jgi:hypothetical protein
MPEEESEAEQRARLPNAADRPPQSVRGAFFPTSQTTFVKPRVCASALH